MKRYNPDCSIHMSHEIAFMRETPTGDFVKCSDANQSLIELRQRLEVMPTRIERQGGQRTKYINRDQALAEFGVAIEQILAGRD
ncbi:hypothetical protein [Serratia fonticola]|uniref:hypothetical protein n=1 Tax=Serratia fonticola TaxID=47917 RepID=UPI0016462839|nr:hypothetical protein [Serratia fonticola]MBC3228329.1 hypothetical protein [Serratia fonticola]